MPANEEGSRTMSDSRDRSSFQGPDAASRRGLKIALCLLGAVVLLAGGLAFALYRHVFMTGLSRRAILKGHASTVQCLAFCADGRLLASGSMDNTIKLWDAHTSRE